MNNTRGLLAEWLVARAVGAPAPVRVELDNYDVLARRRDHNRSQDQRLSTELGAEAAIGNPLWRTTLAPMGGRDTNSRPGETVEADVIVFGVQSCQDPGAYDPLDLNQWDFYVATGTDIEALGKVCPAF